MPPRSSTAPCPGRGCGVSTRCSASCAATAPGASPTSAPSPSAPTCSMSSASSACSSRASSPHPRRRPRASFRSRAISVRPPNINCRSRPRPLKARSPNDHHRDHHIRSKTVLRRLKLSRMLDTLPERLTLARQQKMPHQDLLLLVLSDEVSRRESLAVSLRVQKARLDPTMRLDNWDPPRR